MSDEKFEGHTESDGEKDREPVVAVLGREFPRRRVYVAAGLAAVLLIGGIGAGVAMSASGGTSDGGGQAAAPAVSQAAAAEKEESRVLEIGVAAEGWDEATSSPVIAHIESADGEVDFYHAYAANKAESVEVGRQTSLKVTLISPVNADGSIYKVGNPLTLTSETSAVAPGTSITIEKVDAGSVTAGDLTGIAGQVTEAVKKGDSTLTGDAGSKVVTKVEENIKNSPSATDDVKQSVGQQAGQAQEEAKKEETSAKVPTASGSSSSGSSTSSTQGGSGNTQPASSGSANSSQPQGSGSSSSTNTSQGGSAEHQHTWVAKTVHHDAVTHTETVHHDAVTHTETVHHDAEYATVHHDAVKETRLKCNQCGAEFNTQEGIRAHMKESLLNGGDCGSWTTYTAVVTPAYDEEVQTNAAWDETVAVVDRQAYDETATVTDSAAYDETAYVCSSCGATK